jgi:hypothetical protein
MGIKTTIILPDEIHELLRTEAFKRRTSMAKLITEAIKNQYIEKEGSSLSKGKDSSITEPATLAELFSLEGSSLLQFAKGGEGIGDFNGEDID